MEPNSTARLWERETEFQSMQRMIQEMGENTRKLYEENKTMQEEIQANETKLKTIQEAIEKIGQIQRMQEENRKIQEENEKLHRANRGEELQRAQEVVRQVWKAQRMQEENRRLQVEYQTGELRRSQEVIRAILEAQRMQQECRQLQVENEKVHRANLQNELRREKEAAEKMREAQRFQEDIGKMQEGEETPENMKWEQENRRLHELAKRIEAEATERIRKNHYLQAETERQLNAGIPPAKYPTREEIQAFRKIYQFREDNLHIAITGVSGSGKSSLISAFRGYLYSSSPEAARPRTHITAHKVEAYRDPIRPWILWHEFPDPSPLNVPDWQYFNRQGLFMFDAIIILIENRLTKTDVGLIFNCQRFGIPVFVTRSKADQLIANNLPAGESSNSTDKETLFTAARNKIIKDTGTEFESILRRSGLPPQKIYLVSERPLRYLNMGLNPLSRAIDEVELMRDIFDAVNKRYHPNRLPPRPVQPPVCRPHLTTTYYGPYRDPYSAERTERIFESLRSRVSVDGYGGGAHVSGCNSQSQNTVNAHRLVRNRGIGH